MICFVRYIIFVPNKNSCNTLLGKINIWLEFDLIGLHERYKIRYKLDWNDSIKNKAESM